ncbi:hypothetical protein LP420_22935 [Massilia sp. B-10]|nr:hypothetical protein LP420_22935 [Massilia sp. B-10]
MNNQMRHPTRRVLPAALAMLLTGLLASTNAMAEAKTSWITVGDAAFAHLQKVAPQVIAKESKLLRTNEA